MFGTICNWTLYRKNMLIPIINVKGSCNILGTENILLKVACEIMKVAGEYQARAYPEKEEKIENTEKVVVSFGLIFPTEEELEEFRKNFTLE